MAYNAGSGRVLDDLEDFDGPDDDTADDGVPITTFVLSSAFPNAMDIGVLVGDDAGEGAMVFTRPSKNNFGENMPNFKTAMTNMAEIDGYIAAALVDGDSGMPLAHHSSSTGFNVEAAAAANTEVVRTKRKAMKMLGLTDTIDDILITLSTQYHLIRPMKTRPTVFFYLALDRSKANLALARMKLAETERDLVF